MEKICYNKSFKQDIEQQTEILINKPRYNFSKI